MPNYDRFIGSISARREPYLICELAKKLASASKEMIPLSAGMPNAELFPFMEAKIKLKDEKNTTLTIEGAKMNKALQYLPTQGLPELVETIKKLQLYAHNPPNWENSDIVITSGSQDGLCKSFEMLLSSDTPCGLILEEFVYSGMLAITNPYSPNYTIVASDGDGMDPKNLESRLEESSNAKVLYINPTGMNPTGTVLPYKRRCRIYEICCEKDILILEDDPYYYLQFAKERVPSFLSMDTEGRVLRFDSFSKVLSSGLRLGFVTGPKTLIERVVLHMQASVLHASSLSQVLVNELFNEWGMDGFLNHVDKIKRYYLNKRDLMISAADKHLSGLCEWSIPGGGMFLWLKIYGIDDSWDMIMERAMAKNVMLLPGKVFMVDPSRPCSYARAAFSMASADDFNIAFERLAELIHEEKTK
ncbi:kynurenine/alpha-aminoadipate aminotransferase, mitochondrial [Lepeophtheirus salmonis]|nr:kynurenine/alpha-aminoadipate aminotransferase, mitochondrial-like [Lepeophtheirus salmonis]